MLLDTAWLPWMSNMIASMFTTLRYLSAQYPNFLLSIFESQFYFHSPANHDPSTILDHSLLDPSFQIFEAIAHGHPSQNHQEALAVFSFHHCPCCIYEAAGLSYEWLMRHNSLHDNPKKGHLLVCRSVISADKTAATVNVWDRHPSSFASINVLEREGSRGSSVHNFHSI